MNADNSWTGIIGQHWVRLTQMRDGIRAANRRGGRRLAMAARLFADRSGFGRRAQNVSRRRADARTPWPRAADCACCGRTRGNVSRHSFCPPPSRSSKSGRSSPSSANGLANPCARPAAALVTAGRGEGGAGLVNSDENHLSYSFPTPQRIAAASEAELRACKMGFRAPHCSPPRGKSPTESSIWNSCAICGFAEARGELMTLRGVGGKIADCVLLFAYGFDAAFPVDVWIERALQRTIFSPPPGQRQTAAAICRDAFRSARRLRPAIFFSLHADENETGRFKLILARAKSGGGPPQSKTRGVCLGLTKYAKRRGGCASPLALFAGRKACKTSSEL